MAFTPHNIDEAVRKFWEGSTTLEEEQALRAYFEYSEVPEQYADLAAYFQLAGDDVAAPGPEFDERVLNLTVRKGTRRGRLVQFRPFLRAGAVAAVVAGVWFGVQFLDGGTADPLAGNGQATSLQHAEPEVREAFHLLKEKLSFMSRKMDEGTAHTGKLDKINSAAKDRNTATVSQ